MPTAGAIVPPSLSVPPLLGATCPGKADRLDSNCAPSHDSNTPSGSSRSPGSHHSLKASKSQDSETSQLGHSPMRGRRLVLDPTALESEQPWLSESSASISAATALAGSILVLPSKFDVLKPGAASQTAIDLLANKNSTTPVASPSAEAASCLALPSQSDCFSAAFSTASSPEPIAKPPKASVKALLSQAQPPPPDPELGTLRLQTQPGEAPPDAPNQLTPPELVCDPELGCLRLQDPPLPPVAPARAPVVYLFGRLDYFRSSNIFSAVDPVPDGLLRPGLTLFVAPQIGPATFFTAAVDGSLIRYSTQSIINYNELVFRAGILHRLSPVMWGEIGWVNQQLFIASDDLPGLRKGARFLNEHGIRLELSRRDQLAKNLFLNTYYRFRLGFAQPGDRSRLINSLLLSLGYDLSPGLQLGLDYQYALANFTLDRREDQYHQILARVSYLGIRNSQLSVFAGYSFGSSTESRIDFDGFIFGASLGVTLGF